MTELLTAARMRAIERAAIDSGRVSGAELMERAGRGVVEAIFGEWPELKAAPHKAVVLCGPGNNGGDGFVVARLLKEWGWQVEAALYGDPQTLPPDAQANYRRWLRLGSVTRLADMGGTSSVRDPDLLVDALFGAGLSRPLPDEVRRVLNIGIDEPDPMSSPLHGRREVAVDAPSGLCLDSGRVVGELCRPVDLTVTFHGRKPGHVLADGPAFCGKTVVKSIGLPESRRNGAPGEVNRVDEVEYRGARPPDPRPFSKSPTAHKFSHGHALVLSGGAGRTGAARLAARGALRIGAGLVTVASPPPAMAENAAHLTAIMLKRVEGAEALAGVLEDRRISALCLGPGMGTGLAEAEMIRVALGASRPAHARPPVVLDADALTLLARNEELFGMLHERCVLTPHDGEFARIFPDIAGQLSAVPEKGPAFSRVDAARAAAARAGCVVVLKGPDTVIAAPDGRCAVNAAVQGRAAPWLATAGAGDVLAGFVTGFLARGVGPMQAAGAAAWLHVECARAVGPGLIAEDLPEALPGVLQRLGV